MQAPLRLIASIPLSDETAGQDPVQKWMDEITAANLPWTMADLDAEAGGESGRD